MIAGGGTGGHVFPMLSVGEMLSQMRNVGVFYVGTQRGMEATLIPAAGGDLEVLDVAPLRGGGVIGFGKGALVALSALPQALSLVRRRRPNVVLSVGGYAAGPVALAARAVGVPVAVLEPNGILGLSNRLLAPFAARAYAGFGDISKYFRKGSVKHLGVPLRRAFEATPYTPVVDRFHVLVLGGSQGAQKFNEEFPKAFAQLRQQIPHATVVHQTGQNQGAPVSACYAAQSGLQGVQVTEFVADVASELGRADVVVQRAGASSLAELCVVGRASIVVPYPHAADQHQLVNAQFMQKLGAAEVIRQSDFAAERVASSLLLLATDPVLRVKMADAARAQGKPDAAQRIAEDLVAIANTSPARRSN